MFSMAKLPSLYENIDLESVVKSVNWFHIMVHSLVLKPKALFDVTEIPVVAASAA